jgi:predicted ATPase
VNVQINELEQSGLIRLAQMEPELEYLFRHALVQEAAYDSILKADRKKLHAKVGAILEEHLQSSRMDELLGIITYHFQQAEDWDKALQYGQRAAAQSKRMFANEEALAYYQVTLNAAEKIKQQPNDRIRALEATFEILSARQGVWSLMGLFEKVRIDLEEMSAIARELKDDTRLADALNGLGYFYFNTSRRDPQPFLREALEIKQRIGDKAGEADSLNTLASVLISLGAAEEALQTYNQARQIYEALGSEDGIARSEWSIGLSDYELFGNYEQAQKLFENSRAICQRLGMKGLECGNTMMLGAGFVRMGQIEKAQTTLAGALEMAIQIGDYPAQGWIILYQGWVLREKMKLNEAMELIQKAAEIAEERKIPNLDWYTRYSMAQCKILLGSPQESLKDAQYIYETSRNMKVWAGIRCRSTAILAEVLALTDHEEQAQTYALEALAEVEKFHSVVAELAGVYLSCYKALRTTNPELAKRALQLALERVAMQANSFSTSEARKAFLENVRMNKEIASLADNL